MRAAASRAARRFEERTVIVTGGGVGQGRREAECFAAEGARVVLVDLDGEAAAAAAEQCPGSVRAVIADVAESAAWDAILAAAQDWAPPTVLVNNAAVHWARPIEREEPADVLRMWQINLLGPMLGIQAVTPVMRAAGGGSIVNISSTAGLTGLPYQGSYGASKWGLRGLTKVAAVELAGSGIRVNSVHPGPIETQMMRSSPSHAAGGMSRYAHIPMGRPGTVQEVTSAVLFLASDESSYITGAELAVDGGMLAGRPPSYEWTAELDAQPRRRR